MTFSIIRPAKILCESILQDVVLAHLMFPHFPAPALNFRDYLIHHCMRPFEVCQDVIE